jgi:hypothetical protein
LVDEHQQQAKATLEIDSERKPGEAATHTQRLRLRKIGKTEEALGTRAGELSKAILAEGSVVFAEVLTLAERDLLRLGHDMSEAGDYQSDERVQALQQDVTQSLASLQEALQTEKDRRKKEQQEQKPGDKQQSGKSENRLVPDAAELKLLRRMEVDTLDTLEQMKTLHPELQAEGEIDPLVLEDLARLAHRHQRTSDLFQMFRKRLGLPEPQQQ